MKVVSDLVLMIEGNTGLKHWHQCELAEHSVDLIEIKKADAISYLKMPKKKRGLFLRSIVENNLSKPASQFEYVIVDKIFDLNHLLPLFVRKQLMKHDNAPLCVECDQNIFRGKGNRYVDWKKFLEYLFQDVEALRRLLQICIKSERINEPWLYDDEYNYEDYLDGEALYEHKLNPDLDFNLIMPGFERCIDCGEIMIDGYGLMFLVQNYPKIEGSLDDLTLERPKNSFLRGKCHDCHKGAREVISKFSINSLLARTGKFDNFTDGINEIFPTTRTSHGVYVEEYTYDGCIFLVEHFAQYFTGDENCSFCGKQLMSISKIWDLGEIIDLALEDFRDDIDDRFPHCDGNCVIVYDQEDDDKWEGEDREEWFDNIDWGPGD